MDIASCYAFLHFEPGPGFDWCFLLWTVIPALIKAIPVTFFLLIVAGVLGNLAAIPVAGIIQAIFREIVRWRRESIVVPGVEVALPDEPAGESS